MTDYQQFDDLIQLASKASSVINRVELLKNAIDLYCGKILSSADGEHWLIQFAAKYHIAYVGAVNELLKQLNALHSYDLLNQYLAQELHTSTDYLLTGTGPANDFAKEQLLSAIEVLSSVSKLI